SMIDLRYQIIPDPFNIMILAMGVLHRIIISAQLGMFSSVMDNFLGLIISGSIFLLLATISKGGMGGGDVKLIAVLGFILGLRRSLLNMFLSFILGAIISIFLLLFKIKDRKDAIPFGPFICLAFMITLFWGDMIMDWYLGIL
ncbi:MAG: prepilin peptidase, partial [Tissierellia bacterium]|nr:prepilin peptidase [Tissierellia bacterium]